MYHIEPAIVPECFHLATHSLAASYSIKLATFFNSKTETIYLNPLIANESKLSTSTFF